ncbi:MAG: tetratricopeptide repeat protein [Muricauda sp.]|nr:tetratricopeptide repeat protein [Allomuricauda sp.]MBA4746216.1 tetratricopeptide repeat protein [Allomuricauda sp.]
MLRNLLVFILILLFNVSCEFTSPEEYYYLGAEQVEKGNYQQAIELFNKAIQRRQKFRPALLQRGFCEIQLERDAEAIKDFESILNFDSDNTLALFNLGNCYYNLSEFDKSIQFYSQALNTEGALSSESIQVNLRLIGDIDNDSNYSLYKNEIRFGRATSYFKNDEFEKAIQDFEKVLNTNYRKAECYFWIGHSFMGLNDSIQACHYFKVSANLGFEESKEEINRVCYD